MLITVREGLVAALDPGVVNEMLDAYAELKTNHYLGGHRLSAVEGGRFCEAVVRLLEEIALGSATPLHTRLEVDKALKRIEPIAKAGDSVRLHIPRAIRVIYDIRNKRDTAHLQDGIDPNIQDRTLVVAVADWVLAELVRLRHGVGPEEASHLIADLVERKAATVQDFDGFLKVLNPSLSASQHVLLLLHQRGRRGASVAELVDWARPDMRPNLRRTIRRLVEERALAHRTGDQLFITQAGIAEVNRSGIARPR